MAGGMEPSWIRNFEVYSQTARVMNLSGNVNDIYVCTGDSDYTYYNMNDWLHHKLDREGEQLFYYSPTHGLCDWSMLSNPDETSEEVRNFISLGKGTAKDFGSFAALLASICRRVDREKNFTVVFPEASRLAVNSRALSECEHRAFSTLLSAIRESTRRDRLIFLTDNLSDLPDFMTREGADIRNIPILLPDQVQRRQYLEKLFPEFSAKDRDKLADASDGMSICELQRMTVLIEGSPAVNTVQDAIEQYKYGYKDNPWMEMDREKALGLKDYLQARVFGQDEAVDKISRMIVKAQTGVKKAFNSKGNRRPVGVALMVGPTGTGKTFIAKKTAEYIFGSEDAMIRFDMAEYMQPHAAERLKGAPPGYVGYSEGGQLTNAVKEKPYSIILFDEIEKAHPDVLTLLLGVLEDGVLTSGRGETVSFTNTLLMFTSNLGAAASAEAESNEEAKEIILAAIHRHFYEQIGRPEILGRFQRDNAVTVFNRLGPEVSENMVISNLKQAQENFRMLANIELTWTDRVVQAIRAKGAEDMSANGRAVLAALDKCFEDPLADLFAEKGIRRDAKVEIRDVVEENGTFRLEARVTPLAGTGADGRNPAPAPNPAPTPGPAPAPNPGPAPKRRPIRPMTGGGREGDSQTNPTRRPIARLS